MIGAKVASCSSAGASILLDCVRRVFWGSRQGVQSVLQIKHFEMFVSGYATDLSPS
jgi:hypothetical protein